MKKNYIFTFILSILFSIASFGQDLVITGVIDGPLPGGNPKGFELYAVNAIADLSIYGLESTTNGGGAQGAEYTFPADAIAAGTFIYVGNSGSADGFLQYLGVTVDYENGVASVNGDDTVILYKNGSIEDLVGEVGVDGSNTAWDHLDGWAYRRDGKGPSATFDSTEWTFSGANALDGCDLSDDTGTNAGCSSVFPVGTYNPTGSTDPTLIINNPSDGAVFGSDVTEVPITLTVENFTLSGDAGGGVSDNSGDGYLLATLQESGEPDDVTNQFSTSPGSITVNPGSDYTLIVELVDNSGNSLPVPVTATVTWSVLFLCDLQLGSLDAVCDDETAGTDTYTVTIPFTQGSTATYTITSVEDGTMNAVGTVGGDDPSAVAAGNIVITGVPEGTDITVNITGGAGSSCDLFRNVTSPVCVPVTCPAVGAIIITEIMQNPAFVGDSNGEYFEVYNTTGSPIDLQGWILKDTSSSSETHTISASLVVPANGFAVLGTNTDMGTNGGVPVDYDYGDSYFLGNSADDIVLECGGNVIDEVEWDNGATFPDPSGASMELAQSKFNATDNDDGANWGEAVSEITAGGDLGTPGAANGFTLSVSQQTIEGFAAFPNPVNGNGLTIRSSSIDKKEVALFNVLGRRVFTQSFTGTQDTFDVSNLSSGIYILKVTEGTKNATVKVVIE
jgi:hypothetical protein